MNDDIERIAEIQKRIGHQIPLRIDANQGWDRESAVKILSALKDEGIQHCEEPIPRWDFMSLASVSSQSPIPVMADESCCDEHDAERLISLNACHGFNIKLGKSSGIFRAMKIAELGLQQQMKLQVGGFLESRIGFTASAHLALACPAVHFCDFDTPMMFSEDPVKGGITYGKRGLIVLPETSGLGASVDDAFLKRLETETVK